MAWIRYLAVGALGAIAGFLIGHFGKLLFTVDFKKELGLGDVLNFTVAVIVALFLQHYVQKGFGDRRVEKDHLTSLVQINLGYCQSDKDRVYCGVQQEEIN